METYKFRAWYKGENPHMIYDVEKTYDYRCRGTGCDADCFSDVLADNNYIIMQYTRNDDSMGKPIYDQDIVIIDGHPYLVAFAGGIYRLHYKYNTYDLHVRADSCTVAGNRFENPELMEEVKLWMQ